MGILAYQVMVFFVNSALLYLYLKASRHFHWFDQPNEDRKIHQHATTTSAGLIFMAPMVLAFLLMPNWFPSHSYVIGSILLVLLIIGSLDDFMSVSVGLRLVVVSSVCGFFLYSLYAQHDINYLLLLVYFFGMLWWINLYNFMDGADGMAALHAIVTTCGYIFAFVIFEKIYFTVILFLFLLLLCLLSFILFNFPKAKMFMGDSGSLSVSFLLAVFALFGISQGIFDQILVISFHLVFIVDATLTLLTRLKFKHNLSQAHRLHLFQAMIEAGYSHAIVSVWYAMATLLSVVVALILAFIQMEMYLRLVVLLIEALILSIIWFKYQNATNFKRFLM